jgi:hypothetical protein
MRDFMLLKRSFAIAAMPAAILVSMAGPVEAYTLSVIDAPGAQSTFAVGITTKGIIAGSYYGGGASTSFTYDTKLKKPTFVLFNVPPQHGGTVTETVISAMSATGGMVGNYSETVGDSSKTYGFLYSGGVFTTLDYPGSVQTQVTAIASKEGYVAGYYYTPGFPHPFIYHAGKYRAINVTGLGDYDGVQPQTVNNSGFVTGSYYSVDRSQNRSFTASAATAADFNPTVSGVAACGINGADASGTTLVGYCYSPVQGMIQRQGVVTLGSPPKATVTTFGSISPTAVIAGSATVGTANEIFQLANSVYTITKVPKTWTEVSVVSNNGNRIVGRFTDTKDNAVKVFWAK